MKQIQKSKPPASLVEHLKDQFADYDNYADKDDLRTALVSEQRGICCYCMSYIKADVNYMKIEHHECQDDNPDKQLDYSNLLGACKGNEGTEKKYTHCDTFKGNLKLKIYPPNQLAAIENIITYSNDGTIGSTNKQYEAELDSILNLNAIILKKNRKAALDSFKDYIGKNYVGKQPKRETIIKWINDWSGTSHSNHLSPYCMVIVYWLNKRLNRA